MNEAGTKSSGRPSLRLTVLNGPDAGLSRSFSNQGRIGLGRDQRNEFVLTDGFVSNEHAELVIEDEQIIFRDLQSRHGSLVMVDDVSMNLRDPEEPSEVELTGEAQVQLGCTLIRIAPLGEEASEELAADGGVDAAGAPTHDWLEGDRTQKDGGRETMITTAMRSVEEFPRELSSADDRMKILFRLAGELNGSTDLEAIFDSIVEAIFEAFPAANFFAITLEDDPDKVGEASPFVTRVRGDVPGSNADGEDPILSTSILRKVIETRESVLFVKDSLDEDVSQSIIDAQITACLCAPLVGQRSLLGVMQVDTRGRGSLFSRQDLNLFSVFASNVAFALERAQLSNNIVEIFESFVSASVNAIEARDPTTAGHSERVADYTLELAERVNSVERGSFREIFFNPVELKELRYAALLHDFGKIAVREHVLTKAKRLSETRLEVIRQRFETIKVLRYQKMVRDHFGTCREPLPPEEFHGVEERYQAFCDEMDRTYEWLYEVAGAPYLEDEQIERVHQLGQRQYLAPCGARKPYLTEDEIDNLTIRRGTLNDEEWQNMQDHARQSQAYLERIPWGDELAQVPCIAGAHHEKLDGSGYPAGLTADEIIPQVRMLTIADIFDALTAADRPYRKAATPERAVEILREEADEGKLDTDFVELFADRVVPNLIARIPK